MMAALGTGSFASLNGSGLEQISNLTILFSAICVSAVAKTVLDCGRLSTVACDWISLFVGQRGDIHLGAEYSHRIYVSFL